MYYICSLIASKHSKSICDIVCSAVFKIKRVFFSIGDGVYGNILSNNFLSSNLF